MTNDKKTDKDMNDRLNKALLGLSRVGVPILHDEDPSSLTLEESSSDSLPPEMDFREALFHEIAEEWGSTPEEVKEYMEAFGV
jgi:hypothetical protein